MLHSPWFWIVVGLLFVAMLWLRWLRRRNAADVRIERIGMQAFNLALVGQGWQAEQLLEQLIRETNEKYGPGSRLSGQAYSAQSMLMMALDDYPRAAASLRKACAIEPIDSLSRKERLTHQMNLGELLSRMGNHAEAEEILRQSLVDRGEFYGKRHSGYAYGLESLGEAVLRLGRVDEALALADEALQIDRESRNPHIAQDVALKAIALATRGSSDDPTCLPDWEGLSRTEREGVVHYCHTLANSFDSAATLRVYEELERRLADSPTATPEVQLNVAVAITNMARRAGNHEARIAAFQRVISLTSHAAGLADALLGLALAQADAGQAAEADESYRKAVAAAEKSGLKQLLAQAERNYAIFLADEKRTAEADAMHARSIETARASDDEYILGRALCAAGIHHHHAGHYEAAIPLLEESCRLLPQEHPDAICSQSHLTSARQDQPCDCDQQTPQAIAQVVRDLVLQRAPAGLVQDLRIDFNDEQSPISVTASRKPTEAEGQQLYHAVQNAVGELRRRQALVGYRN